MASLILGEDENKIARGEPIVEPNREAAPVP